MLKEMGLETEEEKLIQKWETNMVKFQDDLKLHKGAKETIIGLSNEYQIGVVSQAPKKALENEMKRLGVDQYMKVTVSSREAENGKPSPEPLLLAVERLGVRPEECIYIGDMIEDIHAAKNANMPVIAVSWGLHYREKLTRENPDHIADDFNQLIGYIQEIG